MCYLEIAWGPHFDTIHSLNSEIIDKADRPCKSACILENYFISKLDDNGLAIFAAEMHWVSKQKSTSEEKQHLILGPKFWEEQYLPAG